MQMTEVLRAKRQDILRLPYSKMWIDYDREADVLYINFKRPQKATDSEMLNDGILLRYRGEELVGVTVLDASKRRRVRAHNR